MTKITLKVSQNDNNHPIFPFNPLFVRSVTIPSKNSLSTHGALDVSAIQTSTYCLSPYISNVLNKFAPFLLLLTCFPVPRMTRGSMSVPRAKEWKWATGTRTLPVPTNGSRMRRPGEA